MKEKIFRIVSGLCMAIGLVWLLGTVGSADLGLIDFETLLIRSIIGIAIFVGGFVGLKLSGSDVVC